MAHAALLTATSMALMFAFAGLIRALWPERTLIALARMLDNSPEAIRRAGTI